MRVRVNNAQRALDSLWSHNDQHKCVTTLPVYLLCTSTESILLQLWPLTNHLFGSD